MTKKHVLACENCGSRNYNVSISKEKRDHRLELKKYCKHCSKHTVHRFE